MFGADVAAWAALMGKHAATHRNTGRRKERLRIEVPEAARACM